jgi:hypothetical protein
MGRVAGFDFMENTMWAAHTRGAEDTNYVCNTSTGITSGSTSITVSGGSGAGNVGDVFTIAGVYAVHPETKVSTGVLYQFVVGTAFLTGATTSLLDRLPVTSGATQNVTIVSAGASKARDLVRHAVDGSYHLDAVSEGSLRFRDCRPCDAGWRGLLRARGAGRHLDPYRARLRHQQRQLSVSSRCSTGSRRCAAARLPPPQQLIAEKGIRNGK